MNSTVPLKRTYITPARIAIAAALASLALLGTWFWWPQAFNSQPQDYPLYALYNYSGGSVMAINALDSAGGQGSAEQIQDSQVTFFGHGHSPTRGEYTIVLQWMPGPGRVRWLEARLPVKIEQRKEGNIEIYLRPDKLVCASLVDSLHSSYAKGGPTPLARVHQDPATLSCVKPHYLPDPMPQTLHGFKQDQITHSWEQYDHGGTSSVSFQQLHHATGLVRIRKGEAFRGGPDYVDEFSSIRPIGDAAAILARSGASYYMVLGDERAWTSRFMGGHEDKDQALGPSSVLLANKFVMDSQSGAMHVLPFFPGVQQVVFEQSGDGKYLSIFYRSLDDPARPDQPRYSEIDMVKLEDGSLTEIARADLPEVPPETNIWEFYGNWYRQHCAWSKSGPTALRCK
ncbi:hypothetical protein AAKU55_004666 [Oxalobacteraceae bacterium GrIS 1.11]